MPIYMKIDGVRGTATDHDHKNRAGASNGGVWKTTNFLTADPAARSASRPGVGVLKSSDGGSTWDVSRMSLFGGGIAVEGRDPSARFKVEQLINTARSQGPNGKLFVATDAGVYQNSDVHGRLLIGTEAGPSRSGAARRAQCINNMRQMPLAMHNTTVDIIITDAGGMVLSGFRLQNASVSRHSGGVLVALGDGSVKF